MIGLSYTSGLNFLIQLKNANARDLCDIHWILSDELFIKQMRMKIKHFTLKFADDA